MSRDGILLMNVGTPDEPTVDSVKTYLREFLLDPDVIDIPAPYVTYSFAELFFAPDQKRLHHDMTASGWMEGHRSAFTHSEFVTSYRFEWRTLRASLVCDTGTQVSVQHLRAFETKA